MKPPLDIRAFNKNDEESVIQLWNDTGLIAPQNDPYKDIQRKLDIAPELFLVAIDGDQLIATVMGGYEGHRAWINYLAVVPEYQHKGVGQKIMRAIEERLVAAGSPKINLQVRSTNSAVIQFYESIGYSQEDVVSMGKRISHDN